MANDPAVWNESYQAQAIKLAEELRSNRHANYAPSYQEKLLLADALMHALTLVERKNTTVYQYSEDQLKIGIQYLDWDAGLGTERMRGPAPKRESWQNGAAA